jgi:outer membrane protein
MEKIAGLAFSLVLFAQCSNDKAAAPAQAPVATLSGEALAVLPIAYVDVDSLLVHFDFYNKLISGYEDELGKKNATINSSAQKFQNEVADFQRKAQNNLFISQERGQQEQTRLERMQQDLEKQAAQAQQELGLKQTLMQQQLSDSLSLGIKEYNTPEKYQMILTKTGNSTILYSNEQYNITEDVIKFLNERFQ